MLLFFQLPHNQHITFPFFYHIKLIHITHSKQMLKWYSFMSNDAQLPPSFFTFRWRKRWDPHWCLEFPKASLTQSNQQLVVSSLWCYLWTINTNISEAIRIILIQNDPWATKEGLRGYKCKDLVQKELDPHKKFLWMKEAF